jgi:sulfur relay (sulfurtransferase) DsrF/TusC family protein
VVGLFLIGKFYVHTVKLVSVQTNKKQYIIKIEKYFESLMYEVFQK